MRRNGQGLLHEFWVPPQLLLAIAALGLLLALVAEPTNGYAGHDYSYFIPRLLEGMIFFKAQGAAIPWYSANLCGGVPFFANPQSLYYSVPQLLSILAGTWNGIFATAIIFVVLEGVGAYLLAHLVFKASSFSSSLAAVFFASNSFYVSRIVVGHLSYHAYALLPLLALLILYRPVRTAVAVPLIGLLGAYFFHSGAYSVAVIALLSLGMLLCLAYTIRDLSSAVVPFQQCFVRCFLGGLLALLISLSKLVAVKSFMVQFPREMGLDYIESAYHLLPLLISQLFLHGVVVQPFAYGFWEYSASVSPLLLLELVLGLLYSARCGVRHFNLISACIGLVLLGATLLFISGHPVIQSGLQLLGLGALRVNVRYTAALILPLIILGCRGFNRFETKRAQVFLFALAYLVAIWGIQLYLPLKSTAVLHISNNYPIGAFSREKQLIATTLQEVSGITLSANNSTSLYDAMLQRTVQLNCYEPLFFTESPLRRGLVDGAVLSVSDARFNILNPACMIFPDENSCYVGDRIEATDEDNLKLFLLHQNPNWRVSRAQAASIVISKWALFITVGYLGIWLVARLLLSRVRRG